MNEETKNAILVLADKIRSKEDELNKLKRVVNGLCADEGQSPMFPNVASESGGSIRSLRIDQFYGQTLAGAARQYLEMRKASGLGAATVNEIYSALKAGGYNFETENEANAKNGVRISLRKNSAIFHRLPNDGGYGLGNWYGIKAANEGSDSRVSRKKGLKRKGKARDIKKQVETASIGSTGTKDSTPQSKPNSQASPKQNGHSETASDRIEGLLASDPKKSWTRDEIVANVPNVKKSSIAGLLNSLRRNGKAQNAGKGLWKSTKT